MKQHILLWWWFFSLNSHIPIFSPHLPYPYFQRSSPLSLFFHPSSPLSLFDFLSSISLNYIVKIQKKSKNLNCLRNDPNVDLKILTIVATSIMLRNLLTRPMILGSILAFFLMCFNMMCLKQNQATHITVMMMIFQP